MFFKIELFINCYIYMHIYDPINLTIFTLTKKSNLSEFRVKNLLDKYVHVDCFRELMNYSSFTQSSHKVIPEKLNLIFKELNVAAIAISSEFLNIENISCFSSVISLVYAKIL